MIYDTLAPWTKVQLQSNNSVLYYIPLRFVFVTPPGILNLVSPTSLKYLKTGLRLREAVIIMETHLEFDAFPLPHCWVRNHLEKAPRLLSLLLSKCLLLEKYFLYLITCYLHVIV